MENAKLDIAKQMMFKNIEKKITLSDRSKDLIDQMAKKLIDLEGNFDELFKAFSTGESTKPLLEEGLKVFWEEYNNS